VEMRRIILSGEGKENNEKLFIAVFVGVLTLLSEKAIDIEEAENYLLSPYTAEALKVFSINERIAELVLYACELEDIESLMPEKLESVISKILYELIQICKKSDKPALPTKKWVDCKKFEPSDSVILET